MIIHRNEDKENITGRRLWPLISDAVDYQAYLTGFRKGDVARLGMAELCYQCDA